MYDLLEGMGALTLISRLEGVVPVATAVVTQIAPEWFNGAPGLVVGAALSFWVMGWFWVHIVQPHFLKKNGNDPTTRLLAALEQKDAAFRNHFATAARESLTAIEVARGTVLPWVKRQDLPDDVSEALSTLDREVAAMKKNLMALNDIGGNG